MKSVLIIAIILIVGCKEKNEQSNAKTNQITTFSTENYELIKPNNSTVLLVIFPGGGSTSKETKENFKIVEKATEKGISVLLMNFSRLWIENEDAKQLAQIITKAVEDNDLNTNKIFIGGMSIGGTTSLTLSGFLTKNNSPIKPNGVFVIDSPIDLYALYESSQKDLMRKDFSEERLAEPKWIINTFEEEFGGKDSLLYNIQKISPLTLKTKNTDNINYLKDKKLRFYTEPDTLWLKENRQTDFENTNAFVLQKTNEVLNNQNWENVELIQTKNKGYRTNGDRNPHSWSIVDVDDLINWILE